MKVYELAKELGVPSKTITNFLKENGENATHMTILTDEQIAFIRSDYETIKTNEEAEKALATTVVNETMKTAVKTDKDYKPDEMIPCRSVFAGTRLFIGAHTGMVYTFSGMGDRRNVEYQDLKAAMLQQKNVLFAPDIIIEDSNLINDEHWSDLKAVYENMNDETDIKRVYELPTRDFEKEFIKLPIVARDVIIQWIASEIEAGTFESYNKAKIVDKICGTRFDLKM